MKYLNVFFLIFAGALLLSGCQSDDTSSMFPVRKRPTPPGGYAPTLATPIPPTSVEEEVLDGAKRWLITFSDINYDLHYLQQRFFSTTDGSFYNIKQLHLSADATAKVDLDFLFGRIQSIDGFLLTYPEQAAATQFKPSNLTAGALAFIVANDPTYLEDEFENSPYAATEVQPYNYIEDKYDFDYYETGDIFLFKTDRTPARYGAIRIVQSEADFYANSRTVEVTVQTGNSGFIQANN
ncbi:MAG: hypothetical protein AAF632_26155 [Bacteroidota bacterium]